MATQTPAKIIGLYGLPGIGKTTLLNLLKEWLPHDAFAFYEGSEMVANAAGGSLDTFRNADGNTNNLFRAQAIANIAGECTASGKTGIVTGHYSFLNAGAESPGVVFSAAETRHYTHIIYLSASGEEIEQRCRDDTRARVPLTAAEINRWAAKEVKELEPICYRNRILLSVLRIEQMSPIKVAEVIASLIQRFHLQSPALNEHRVTTVMNEFLSKQSATLQNECTMLNVHGKLDVGHRLQHEEQILIVPLMRGGEPMAMGVSNVFSEVMFLHAKSPADMTLKHLDRCKAVILVDSVVNSGASIAEFVTHIRARRVSVPVVVVAGVVQADAVRPGGSIRKMALKNDIAIVALQLSDNKYTGKGVTDTGARLFNTTALESE
nr:hypothetical protein B0A51_04070 [Rachicladosporium sp. CCFEE 5018]